VTRSGIAAAMLGAALSSGLIAPASAANFYFVGSPDMSTITLLDPGTISLRKMDTRASTSLISAAIRCGVTTRWS
jgi:hypothetical protein